ncbi:myosin heavy chain, cardiac muscle isoform-like [Rhopalosiphum maidis]|uniref:myosin heavy chain, cardiac muscle isoform-like n=1 Tax=Rhopalosiphum maidis TaxID=43146 RepID=UPI000EFE7035|nr:myosin heavy chain, cardiac muscle isoform-like [Rhopalosiphum maidis]
MIYGTSTKLRDLQLKIIDNINSKPVSIVYRNERVPNVYDRVSRPLKYTKDPDVIVTDNKPEKMDTSEPRTSEKMDTSEPSVFSNLVFRPEGEDGESLRVISKPTTASRQKVVDVWMNQVRDVQSLLDDRESDLDENISSVRNIEKQLNPMIRDRVDLQFEKNKNLDKINVQLHDNVNESYIEERLQLQAAELLKKHKRELAENELKIQLLEKKLNESIKSTTSFRKQNISLEQTLNEHVIESNQILKDLQKKLDDREQRITDLRSKLKETSVNLHSLENSRELNEVALDSELIDKNKTINELRHRCDSLNRTIDLQNNETQILIAKIEEEQRKNKALATRLNETRIEKSEIEQRSEYELNQLREQEQILKSQLNDTKTRIDVLDKELQKSSETQYSEQQAAFAVQYESLKNKYELQEARLNNEIREHMQQTENEVLKNTKYIEDRMNKKIEDITLQKAELEYKYAIALQKIKENENLEEYPAENEQLRAVIREKDRDIENLNSALAELKNTVRVMNTDDVYQQTAPAFDESIDVTELLSKSHEQSEPTSSSKTKKYTKNRKSPYVVVESKTKHAPTAVSNKPSNRDGDARRILQQTVDAVVETARTSTDDGEIHLYTETNPISVNALRTLVNKLWTYVQGFDRATDAYDIKREHAVSLIKFNDFKTSNPSSEEINNFEPTMLFDNMNNGVFASTQTLFVISQHWLYYEPTAQFIHACYEKACWFVLSASSIDMTVNLRVV